MRPRWMVVALVLSACGSPQLIGTWHLSGTVVNETLPSMPSVMFDDNYVIADLPPLSWHVGDGCDAELVQNDTSATLRFPGWNCKLKSGDGLPLSALGDYQWEQGDSVQVFVADFNLVSQDRLSVSFQVGLAGHVRILKTPAGNEATRVK